jgi:hypothetical protein
MQQAPVEGPFSDDDPDFRLLVGQTLVQAGRRYRNCLAQHLGHVAAGRRLYYEWLHSPGAVVELHCLSDGQKRIHFSVGQIRGKGNSRLLPEVLNQIRRCLSCSGVLFNGVNTGRRAPLNGLLDIFEDVDADDAVVSFLDDLEAVCADRALRAA